MTDNTIKSEGAKRTPNWKFILRGCLQGGQCAWAASICLSFLISAGRYISNFLSSGLKINPGDVIQIIGSVLLMFGFVYLYTIWFGVAGGGILAWIFLRIARKKAVEKKQAINTGLLVGAITGLIMYGLPLALWIMAGGWSTMPHGGIYPQVEKNKLFMESHIWIIFLYCAVIAITSGIGWIVSNQLIKDMPDKIQS